MPFDYEGAKAAGYSDGEIQGFLAQGGGARPPTPVVAPMPPEIRSNLGANQKALEAQATQLGKQTAEEAPMTQNRTQALTGLDETEQNLEMVNQRGGMSNLYDLPLVTPAIHAAYSGLGVGRGMNDNAGNRDVYKSNIGSLATQLKKIVRGSGEGVWTDYDQRFLMSILPSGGDYKADKRIIQGLRDGSLLNQAQQYRASDKWKEGLSKAETPAQPVPLSTDKPQSTGAVDYREYFK